LRITSSVSTGRLVCFHAQLAADRVWEIDTGHALTITEPDAVAEML
jgi:hypothetical protein